MPTTWPPGAHLILICPRYEGVDERIRRTLVDLELSIGDYVLTGGELPALVVIDAVLRLLPGAIDAESTIEESFADGLLEYPQYTRPATFAGLPVPPILVGGDHGAVRRWRHLESIRRTLARRPDLSSIGRGAHWRRRSSMRSGRRPTSAIRATMAMPGRLTWGRRPDFVPTRPSVTLGARAILRRRSS